MKLISGFCLTCIFLCGIFSLKAECQQGKDIFYNADSLFNEGKYFESALAYERIYFFSGDPETRARANLARAGALKQTGEFARARNDLQRSLGFRGNPEIHYQVMYEIAFCDYMTGNYASSLSVLMQMEHFYGDMPTWDDALALYALVYVMLGSWDDAFDKTLELIELRSPNALKTDSLVMKAMAFYYECRQPLIKSERKASNLSTFIPGAGQAYSGYHGKGLINASSQLLSLGITGLMVYHNLYISGFVIGLGMFQSFYFGGIKQAGYLANQFNLEETLYYKSLLKDFILEIDNLKVHE
jgi:tetratricopeptide (TPR) repeat protein